jgi:HEPN domain-containing protein
MNRYRDWIEQALRDFEKAKIDFQYEYWEWCCFTCQQAAEKACKALLMKIGHTAWGHSITPMLNSLEEIPPPKELIMAAQLLDEYYIPARYPNGFAEGKPADYFNQVKAEKALDAAREIIRFCQTNLN